MRGSRVASESDSQCRRRNCPEFDPQHPPTQWILRGGRRSNVEYIHKKNQLLLYRGTAGSYEHLSLKCFDRYKLSFH
jgi:hypothetical protein